MVFEENLRGNLQIISNEAELMSYFNERLGDLDYDKSVKTYVSGLMTDFAYERGNNLMSVLFSEVLERVRLQKLSEERDFISLKDMGDTFLWMCGFFPEHVIDKNRNKPRFLLTLEDYIKYGKIAYYQASTLFKDKELPIREISRNFEWVAHSILNLRERMNPNLRYFLHEETVKEIEKILNDGQPVLKEPEKLSFVRN